MTPSELIRRGSKAGRFVLALIGTLAVTSLVVVVLGASPWAVAKSLVSNSVGHAFPLGQTIVITSLLALTGLAAAIPFRAGVWNVGGEGQLYAGAIGAVAVSLTAPPTWPTWLFVITTSLAGILAGAFWGSLTAFAKVIANANEVIVGLMLSFVAIILSSYMIRVVWYQGISPQTRTIPSAADLPTIWSQGLVTIGVIFAVVGVVLAWAFLHRTSLGFQVRAVGLNSGASQLAGISAKRMTVITFALGGGAAGLAGAIAVTGINHALVANFSANYGYLGIAVALVARLEPLLVIPAAFLFSALQVGSNGLDVDLGLSSSLGQVIITVFIVALMYFRLVRMESGRAGL